MVEPVTIRYKAVSRALDSMYSEFRNKASKPEDNNSITANSISNHANNGGADNDALKKSNSTSLATVNFGNIAQKGIVAAFSFHFGMVGKSLFYLGGIIKAIIDLPYKLTKNSSSNLSHGYLRGDEIGYTMLLLSKVALSDEVLNHIEKLNNPVAKNYGNVEDNVTFKNFRANSSDNSNSGVTLKVGEDVFTDCELLYEDDTRVAAYKTRDRQIIVVSATVCVENNQTNSPTTGILLYDQNDPYKSMPKADFENMFTKVKRIVVGGVPSLPPEIIRPSSAGSKSTSFNSVPDFPSNTELPPKMTEETENSSVVLEMTEASVEAGNSSVVSGMTEESVESGNSSVISERAEEGGEAENLSVVSEMTEESVEAENLSVVDREKYYDNPLVTRKKIGKEYVYSEWNDAGNAKVEVYGKRVYGEIKNKVPISQANGLYNLGVYVPGIRDANRMEDAYPSLGQMAARKVEPIGCVSIEEYGEICRDVRKELCAIGKEHQFVVPTPLNNGGWRVAITLDTPTVRDFKGKDFIWSKNKEKLYVIESDSVKEFNKDNIQSATKIIGEGKFIPDLDQMITEIRQQDFTNENSTDLEAEIKNFLDRYIDEYTGNNGKVHKPKIRVDYVKVMMPYVPGKPLGESYTPEQYYQVVEGATILYELGYPLASLDGKPDNFLELNNGDLVRLDLFLLKRKLGPNDMVGNYLEHSGLDRKKYLLMRAACDKQGISFNVVNQLQVVASPAAHLLGDRLLDWLFSSKELNEDYLITEIIDELPRLKGRNRDEYIEKAINPLRSMRDAGSGELASMGNQLTLLERKLTVLIIDSPDYKSMQNKITQLKQEYGDKLNEVNKLATRIEILSKLLVFLPEDFKGFGYMDDQTQIVNQILDALYKDIPDRNLADKNILCKNILDKLLPQTLPQPFTNRDEYINFQLNWFNSYNYHDMSKFYYSTFIEPYIKLPFYNDQQFFTQLNQELSEDTAKILNNQVVSILALFECKELRGEVANSIKENNTGEFKQLLRNKLEDQDFPQGFNSKELHEAYISFITNLVFGKNVEDIIKFNSEYFTIYRNLPFYTDPNFKQQLVGKGISSRNLLAINKLISTTLDSWKVLPDIVGTGKKGIEKQALNIALRMMANQSYPRWVKTPQAQEEFKRFLKNWIWGENIDQIIEYCNESLLQNIQ